MTTPVYRVMFYPTFDDRFLGRGSLLILTDDRSEADRIFLWAPKPFLAYICLFVDGCEVASRF